MRAFVVAGLVSALALGGCNFAGGRESAEKNDTREEETSERDRGRERDDERSRDRDAESDRSRDDSAGDERSNRDGDVRRDDEGTGSERGGETSLRSGGSGRQEAGQVQLVNRTGSTVITLQVSPTSDPNWGPDILGRDVLPNGQVARVDYNRAQGCTWDIRVTFDNGRDNDWRNVNLCEANRITLDP